MTQSHQAQSLTTRPQSLVTRERIAAALSYEEYIRLSEELFAQGRTTSDADDLNTPKHLEYTKLNLQRMRRIDKTFAPSAELTQYLRAERRAWIWFVLSESWCGDAAQNLPALAQMAAEANGTIELKIALRDKNLDIMDAYLTGSSRSIPKLICLRADSLDEIGVWGPRPAEAQEFVLRERARGVEQEALITAVHAWYARDKFQALQRDFALLLPQWNGARP